MPNPKHLIHAHSSVVTNGEPKLPAAARIEYGEIAVNFAEGYETLSIKNSNDDIVTFSSDEKLYDVIIENERAVATALNDMNDRISDNMDAVDDLETSIENQLDDKLDKMVSLTYTQLNTKKDNSQLVPGQMYRITDYVATTTQNNTASANHPFDIIVTATDVNKLSEIARAVRNENDSYFGDGTNFEAWELKYTLSNTAYGWGDAVNGKGIIYYMKDENDNEAFYDFKGITFTVNSTTYYTFNGSVQGSYFDASLAKNYCHNNVIKPWKSDGTANWSLPFIVMITGSHVVSEVRIAHPVYNNFFDSGCNNIMLFQYCGNNHFGIGCNNITLGASNLLSPEGCVRNYFGDNCEHITLIDACNDNHFENSCQNINLSSSSVNNYFNQSCSDITLQNIASENLWFGANSNNITIGPALGSANSYTFQNITFQGNSYLTINSTMSQAGTYGYAILSKGVNGDSRRTTSITMDLKSEPFIQTIYTVRGDETITI